MQSQPHTATIGECPRCHRKNQLLLAYVPPYGRLRHDQATQGSLHQPLIYDRPEPRLLCPDCYNAAEMAAENRLHRAAPDLLRMCQLVLARLDLEAEQNPGPFVCAAMRDDLRYAIELAITEEAPA